MGVKFEQIQVGQTCSRMELAKLWGYAGSAALGRGVVSPSGDNKIILFVTREKRPEDEQYDDELVGNILLWEGPNDHFAEERLLAQERTGEEIHLFYRKQHREDFTYVGQLRLFCCQQFKNRPSRFAFRVRVSAR